MACLVDILVDKSILAEIVTSKLFAKFRFAKPFIAKLKRTKSWFLFPIIFYFPVNIQIACFKKDQALKMSFSNMEFLMVVLKFLQKNIRLKGENAHLWSFFLKILESNNKFQLAAEKRVSFENYRSLKKLRVFRKLALLSAL